MARKGAAVKPAPEMKPVDDGDGAQLLNEVAGVVTVAVALFTVASFLSFQFGDGKLAGPVGYGLSSGLIQTFGLTMYLLPVFLGVMGVRLFRSGLDELSAARVLAIATLLVSISVLLALLLQNSPIVRAGGWLGGFIGTVLQDACGVAGAYVIGAALFVLAMMFATETSLRSGTTSLTRRARAAYGDWRTRRAQAPPAPVAPTNRLRIPSPARTPVIVLNEEAAVPPERRPPRPTQEVLPFVSDAQYTPPPLSLLDAPRHSVVRVDEEALCKSSEILEAKLANFGIEGKVVAVRPGPVITTFEIEPAPGVKVNRIVTLQDDLTMALRALSVRILAPVPGKAVVGIEVANTQREQVYLAEILESDAYAQSASTLTLALGKDSAGYPVVADLARMPHLLLAGATGTGKSVSLNAMIMSILCKSSPRDVRFVMIDLKMLELSLYDDLPHLLVPVVTDAKKAVVVLKNLVEQMDQRYRLLKEKGVRSVDSYNRVVEPDDAGGGDRKIIELEDVVEGDTEPGSEPTLRHERLPKIVVIIDELADLMMSAGRNVEEPITRLAQKARAAGIHLILATQRPSVDVITGLIKANFPARVSFQVTARVDSRTILDCIGAERLLGGGDMLYLPPGTARVQRLHGAFVSEAEIRKVTNFVKQQAKPQYVMELLEGGDEDRTDIVDVGARLP